MPPPFPSTSPHLGLAVVPHCCTSTAITMVGEELEEEVGEERRRRELTKAALGCFFFLFPSS